MGSRAVKGAAPSIVNSSVRRTREYFTPAEVERLMAIARKASRYGHRDATLILIAYRHGLRASELCDLQWHQVELTAGRLHVRRTKRGISSVHPMQGDEIRALRRLQREHPSGPHVFATERGGPMAPKSFHTLIARLGERAKMPFPIHPHMLRHGCGYALANAGHDTRALQQMTEVATILPMGGGPGVAEMFEKLAAFWAVMAMLAPHSANICGWQRETPDTRSR